jgi:hypothetical protein
MNRTEVAQKLISLMLMGFKDSIGWYLVMPYFYSFTMVKFTAVNCIVFKLLVGKLVISKKNVQIGKFFE